MKRTKIYDFTTRALMVLLAVFMLAVSARYAVRKIVVEGMGLQGRTVSLVMFDAPELVELPVESVPEEKPEEPSETPPSAPVRDRDGIVWSTKVDWQALYPAPADDEDTAADAEKKKGFAWQFAAFLERFEGVFAPFEAKVSAFEEELDLFATDYAVGYDKMVELANAYDGLLGWEIASVMGYNAVIEAGENYFLTCVSPQGQYARAQESVDLANLCRELGMEHLFVETPNKTCRADATSGVMDFYNQNADRLLEALAAGGVATVDLRENLHAAGMDHHASFFETDHHWKSETGLWAAGEVAKELNERYGFQIDLSLFDPARFEHEVYEDWFLGSQGKKVTLARAVPEDITLLYPAYDVDLGIRIPSMDVDKRGDFSIMYRYAAIDECDYYNLNPYGAFLYGDNALTHLANYANTEGRRILVLGHSFDNSVLPFLALGVAEVDSMDLREFNGSLETYLRENHYDVVIELYTI